MQVSRSRILIALLTVPVAFAMTTGCGKKKIKTEKRLPAMLSSLTDGTGGAGAFGGPGTNGWGPNGAPDANGGFGNTGSEMANAGAFGNGSGSGSLDGASGGLLNDTNVDGVAGGAFNSELEMIHFDFDSSDIPPEWKTVLDGHAEWLKSHPTVMVQVEGHCDDRGTDEYNVALGQRRADVVREYLVGDGVDANRLSTISYGELRPIDFAASEDAHMMNRRAMFLVYEVDNSVANSTSY